MIKPRHQRIILIGALVYVIFAAFFGSIDFREWNIGGSEAVAATAVGDFDFSLSVVDLNNGTLNSDVETSQVITLTRSDWANESEALALSFTMNVAQTDGVYDTTKPFVIEATGTCFQGSNVDDSSDSTLYRTCDYSANNWYTYEINGISFSNANSKAVQSISYAQVETMPVNITISPATTLDKLTKNDYDEAVVATVTLTNGKTVTVKYIQTPTED